MRELRGTRSPVLQSQPCTLRGRAGCKFLNDHHLNIAYPQTPTRGVYLIEVQPARVLQGRQRVRLSPQPSPESIIDFYRPGLLSSEALERTGVPPVLALDTTRETLPRTSFAPRKSSTTSSFGNCPSSISSRSVVGADWESLKATNADSLSSDVSPRSVSGDKTRLLTVSRF